MLYTVLLVFAAYGIVNDNNKRVRRYVHSSARSTALLNTARERGGDARGIGQPHVCRHWIADAFRQVAPRRSGVDSGGKHPDRQERSNAERHSGIRNVHVRRRLRPGKY